MAEHKSPGERALDLVVFGPAGLALTAAEEFPKLVDKGRHRLEGQVHTARLVGQFAVQMGRRRLGQLVNQRRSRDESRAAEPQRRDPVAAPTGEPGHGPHTEPEETPAVAVANGHGPVPLAIPGYDSLSASQVVQRLAGLSHSELVDVRDHEQSHRHRRTILNRVEQLLAGVDAQ